MKNPILQEAAKKLGSQAALAKHLGVSENDICHWTNLRRIPPFLEKSHTPSDWAQGDWWAQGDRRSYPNHWTQERIESFESKLFALTGKTLNEVFPSTDFVDTVSDLPPHSPILTLVSEASQANVVLPDPSSLAELRELQRNIMKVVNTLTERRRDAVIMYYGLDGNKKCSLREIADHLNLKTPEGARAVLKTAMKKLCDPRRAVELVGHLDYERRRPTWVDLLNQPPPLSAEERCQLLRINAH